MSDRSSLISFLYPKAQSRREVVASALESIRGDCFLFGCDEIDWEQAYGSILMDLREIETAVAAMADAA